jgi:hypothetical protein
MFISILCMLRAAMCPSSGELTVSIRHLVYVTLYRWPFGAQIWMRLRLIQTCTLICSSYGLSWDRTWVSTVWNRSNYDKAESFKESSDKEHMESVDGTTGLYLLGVFYVQLFSHLLPSNALKSQAVHTPQLCGSRHENTNKTPTEIWTPVSET